MSPWSPIPTCRWLQVRRENTAGHLFSGVPYHKKRCKKCVMKFGKPVSSQKKLITVSTFKLGFRTVILYQPTIFLTAKIDPFHFAPMNPDPWCDADCWEGPWMPMMRILPAKIGDVANQQKWIKPRKLRTLVILTTQKFIAFSWRLWWIWSWNLRDVCIQPIKHHRY